MASEQVPSDQCLSMECKALGCQRAHADEIIRGMQASGFQVRELFQRHDGALATARLTLGETATRCGLLFSTSGIEHLVVAGAVSRELAPGTRAQVIQRPHLIAMKLVAGRGQDRIDIEALLDAASSSEVDEVPRALQGLDATRKGRALALWSEILDFRREREPDLFPAPERLRALQRRKSKR